MSIELGRIVEQRRHELGLSRRDLAQQAEVSYPYVSQIETGDRDPSLKTLRRLAEVLDLPVETLAGLVSQDSWALSDLSSSMPSASIAGMVSAPRSAPMPASYSLRSPEPSADRYREKLLPSIERKLASVPPLARLELLNELTAKAVEELRRSSE